jgi:hypothetical protein
MALPSLRKSIFATPDGRSVALADRVMTPRTIWPAVRPATSAALGGSVSMPKLTSSVPRLWARSSTLAESVCGPSARATGGV